MASTRTHGGARRASDRTRVALLWAWMHRRSPLVRKRPIEIVQRIVGCYYFGGAAEAMLPKSYRKDPEIDVVTEKYHLKIEFDNALQEHATQAGVKVDYLFNLILFTSLRILGFSQVEERLMEVFPRAPLSRVGHPPLFIEAHHIRPNYARMVKAAQEDVRASVIDWAIGLTPDNFERFSMSAAKWRQENERFLGPLCKMHHRRSTGGKPAS